jgi:hypothetical protein
MSRVNDCKNEEREYKLSVTSSDNKAVSKTEDTVPAGQQ